MNAPPRRYVGPEVVFATAFGIVKPSQQPARLEPIKPKRSAAETQDLVQRLYQVRKEPLPLEEPQKKIPPRKVEDMLTRLSRDPRRSRRDGTPPRPTGPDAATLYVGGINEAKMPDYNAKTDAALALFWARKEFVHSNPKVLLQPLAAKRTKKPRAARTAEPKPSSEDPQKASTEAAPEASAQPATSVDDADHVDYTQGGQTKPAKQSAAEPAKPPARSTSESRDNNEGAKRKPQVPADRRSDAKPHRPVPNDPKPAKPRTDSKTKPRPEAAAQKQDKAPLPKPVGKTTSEAQPSKNSGQATTTTTSTSRKASKTSTTPPPRDDSKGDAPRRESDSKNAAAASTSRRGGSINDEEYEVRSDSSRRSPPNDPGDQPPPEPTSAVRRTSTPPRRSPSPASGSSSDYNSDSFSRTDSVATTAESPKKSKVVAASEPESPAKPASSSPPPSTVETPRTTTDTEPQSGRSQPVVESDASQSVDAPAHSSEASMDSPTAVSRHPAAPRAAANRAESERPSTIDSRSSLVDEEARRRKKEEKLRQKQRGLRMDIITKFFGTEAETQWFAISPGDAPERLLTFLSIGSPNLVVAAGPSDLETQRFCLTVDAVGFTQIHLAAAPHLVLSVTDSGVELRPLIAESGDPSVTIPSETASAVQWFEVVELANDHFALESVARRSHLVEACLDQDVACLVLTPDADSSSFCELVVTKKEAPMPSDLGDGQEL
jgi:hypothetical protein